MQVKSLRLRKGEDKRLRSGHLWVYSNEIDTRLTPLKRFEKGEEVVIENANQVKIAKAYVNPHSLITARIFSFDLQAELNENFFIEKIRKALELRELLFIKPFYRLVFGEADQLPGLVIDRFAENFVIQINTAGMEVKQDVIVRALQSIFPNINSILFRNDAPIREMESLDTYVKSAFGSPPDEIQIEENDIPFYIPFHKGQKTGWFYDHRYNRAKLKTYVSNKKVLDVFSYLGAFGIQTAVFGAKQVDCIETSQFAADYIKRNSSLNHVADQVQVICDDAFDAMKNLLKAEAKYDVIIIDPPAFIKKFKDQKEGVLAYQRINELALRLLNPGGILFSCSCSMHLSMDDLIEVLQKAASKTSSQLQLIEFGHQGPDHPIHPAIPETNYLKLIVALKTN